MPKLAVNVDHIATIREARKTNYPDPVAAAVIAELAGADAIVVHLREDRRHIKERDVRILRDTVQTRLILEMAATSEMLEFALEVLPDLVTFVPERRQEVTTEGGLDVLGQQAAVTNAIETLRSAGIPACLFVDPSISQIEAAHAAGADSVELHTGTFCDATDSLEKEEAFTAILRSARRGKEIGLGVNAGHGICYRTIQSFKGVKDIDEFSIGHSIVSHAALVGMENAVRRMAELIRNL
ncbi:pyridoxine 5'-phosphate synthase [Desulfobotulus sp. H1]|uniref:Pyridoxine 5'-phosphate synthase n=1 Tax=Desulfobotulus pelophilus TaxID=2823377 RepID=A0ABT3N4U9_9BACT|nr:pyridoxine 5'-phosphate synthase [Desulfobotulus pelophilus]MCW7752483.1 pyridoxine 5'-phosphate synthase [Desulfobotulus pelophilus]